MNTIDIKALREKYSLSQQQLANQLGVHKRTIQNWERGGVIPESKNTILHSFIKQKEMEGKRMGINKYIGEYLRMINVEITEASKVSRISYHALNSIINNPDRNPPSGLLKKFKIAYPGFSENDDKLIERLESYSENDDKPQNYGYQKNYGDEVSKLKDEIIILQRRLLNFGETYRIKIKFTP